MFTYSTAVFLTTQEDTMTKTLKYKIYRIVVALVLMIIAANLNGDHYYTFSLALWFAAFVIGGYDKAIEGWHNTIKNRALNVEFLMILAATAAFFTQDFAEGAILIFIFAMSGVLEEYARSKSEKELKALLELTPQRAIKLENDKEVEVDISQLSIGDRVIVKVGQQVPVDGIIVEGSSSLNEAVITGEFLAMTKRVHDRVYAGSLNEEAVLVVSVTTDPTQTVVSRIVEFVKEAQEKKTPSETFLNRFEKYYVYIVLGLSLATMILPPLLGWLSWSDAFYRGVIVLVVGSPCAVVASITPAILASLSNAASKGILIKGGESLERLNQIKVVIFDKTGTITEGKPKVDEIMYQDGVNQSWLNAIISNMERQSSHPLAKAIVYRLSEQPKLEINTKEEAGYGLVAQYEGHIFQIGRYGGVNDLPQRSSDDASVVNVVMDGNCVAQIYLKDQLRKGVEHTITKLKQVGITPVLVSGDKEGSVKAMAARANIDLVHAQCLPQDKVKWIELYTKQLGAVMMVGDGINDAPSLASAFVGVAMGSATDVSLETSDIVLTQNSIEAIVKLKMLAKQLKAVVRQNLTFSIVVIVVLMVSNGFGLIQLPQGVLAHELSTIIVIMNSLRLLRIQLH